jgi:hypothetical protein
MQPMAASVSGGGKPQQRCGDIFKQAPVMLRPLQRSLNRTKQASLLLNKHAQTRNCCCVSAQ